MDVQSIYDLMTKTFGVHESNQRFDLHFYRALNNAQQEIYQKRKWGFLLKAGTLTTSASTRTADLPDTFGKFDNGYGKIKITSPSGSAGGNLSFYDAGRYLQDKFDDDEEGTPTIAYIIDDTAYLSPIPDAIYIISFFYYAEPAQITGSDGTIIVPDRYGELLETIISRYLNRLGYSSIADFQIDDKTVSSLFYQAAQDDLARYGTKGMNLPPSAYTRNVT